MNSLKIFSLSIVLAIFIGCSSNFVTVEPTNQNEYNVTIKYVNNNPTIPLFVYSNVVSDSTCIVELFSSQDTTITDFKTNQSTIVAMLISKGLDHSYKTYNICSDTVLVINQINTF